MTRPWTTAQAVGGLALLGVGVWLMSPGWACVVVGGIIALDAMLRRAQNGGE